MSNQHQSNQSNNNANQKPANIGGLRWVFSLVANIIAIALSCLMLSVIIEYTFSALGWWGDNSLDHARVTAWKYLEIVKRDTEAGSYLLHPAIALTGVMNLANQFGVSFENLFTDSPTSHESLIYLLKHSVLIIGYCIISMTIKVSYILCSLPLGLLLLIPLLHDGYCYRKIRKYVGQRDSDFKLNVSAKFANTSFIGVIIIFFALPIYIEPIFIVLPTFIITAFAMRLVVVHYTKYF